MLCNRRRSSVTALDVLEIGDELRDEDLRDAALDDDAVGGKADLAFVESGAHGSHHRGPVEIGVVEDDGGVLAAELHQDWLHVFGCSGGNGPTNVCAANEIDLADVLVSNESFGNGCSIVSVRADEVDDSGRTAGLMKKFDEKHVAHRGHLGCLEDHGAAGGNGG